MFKKTALVVALSSALFLPGLSQAATCIGNCGTSGADGDVTSPPNGASYSWISTFLGTTGGGTLPGYEGSNGGGGEGGGEIPSDMPALMSSLSTLASSTSGFATNGSSLISDAFYAAKGAVVEFWFNYVTSDGSGFADYAWSQLRNTTNSVNTTLFTARTKPEGNIAPGQDLPAVTATLNPSSVEITPNATNWTPLGDSSGGCYAAGCGNTGWVKSSYTVLEAGTYQLAFGVTNWNDTAYDSGLAFNGLVLNGNTIGDGSSASSPLLPDQITETGAFVFNFTPTPANPVFIDPDVAVGYDYKILSGGNFITKAIFPNIAGDTDGYQIYVLGDTSATGLLGTVLPGGTFVFSNPVTGFSLRGIDVLAGLNPTNSTAFVTGLYFANGEAVSISQSAVAVPVPEPETYAMLLTGLFLLGIAKRRNAA